jgi:hypothetical protein
MRQRRHASPHRRVRRALAAASAATALAGAPLARAAEPDPVQVSEAVEKHGARNSVFSVGVAGLRHSLKSGGETEVIGNAAAVQLGTGYISESWYVTGSLDILLGPYEPANNSELDIDYFGTGATIWTGFSAQTLNLRSAEGGYGFALGLSYADSVGRLVGQNRKREGEADGDVIDEYVIRVNNLSLLPGIFFSWLQPARPRGNTPDLLATRLEGYFLTIGMAMPLLTSFSAKSETRNGEPDNKHGQLRGYSIMLALSSMLGT